MTNRTQTNRRSWTRLLGLFCGLGWLAVTTLAQVTPPTFEGTWQGTLGGALRLVVRLSKASDGLMLGTLESVDQNSGPIAIDTIDVTGTKIRLVLNALNAAFEGSLADGRLDGTFTQNGRSQPLGFTRRADAAGTATPASTNALPSTFPLGRPIEVRIPTPPVPFLANGQRVLAYELHLSNFSAADMLLTAIEVRTEAGTVATFEGAALNALLSAAPSGPDRRTIPGRQRSIAFMWVAPGPGASTPQTLRHRLRFGDDWVDTESTNVLAMKPLALGPPLRGANWIAGNGPANGSAHRRALLVINGTATIAQRFAIDWVRAGSDGATFSGSRLDNRSYHAYGQDALAVADGAVAATKDGIPENVPGANSRAVPITLETLGGNHIILDLGDGRFAFYAHLQPGSLKVRIGDRVKRGQVLGLVGNSGNSTEPHLHFDLTDSSANMQSEGVPYAMEQFEQRDSTGQWQIHRGELPLANAVIRFPE